MKYNDLTLDKQKKVNRVGRGIAAGQGKTAGRGTKGQNARSGGGVRPGFEGGQNPLIQRLPKLPGFKSKRVKAENVYTGQLAAVGEKIDNFTLAEAGVVSSPYVRVKLISGGNVTKKHTVTLQSASKTALQTIEQNGGSFTKTEQQKRPKQDKNTSK